MTRQTSSIISFFLLASTWGGASGQEAEVPGTASLPDTRYIDVHIHLRSNGHAPGSPGPRDYTIEGYLSSATNLIALMDTHGVEMKNRIVDGDWQITREWLNLMGLRGLVWV